jgi:hypothetical protein
MATYTLISSNVLSSSAASVTFSSIPTTYTDLVVRASARNTDTNYSWFNIQYNGDATGNYSVTQLRGDASTATSARTSNTSSQVYNFISTVSNTASTFGSSEIYIPNYLSTTTKPSSSFSVQESDSASTNVNIGAIANLWRGTTAISSITLTSASGESFVATSSFYLYGISNA